MVADAANSVWLGGRLTADPTDSKLLWRWVSGERCKYYKCIKMLNNINKLQNVEACLHFLVLKCPLTQVGMHYKSTQVAHINRVTLASQ